VNGLSNYQSFLEEKLTIDGLIERDFKISDVQESLDGDVVEMKKGSAKQTFLLTNPDSRKYLATILIKQQKQPN